MDDIEYLKRQLIAEIEGLNEAKVRSIAATRNSFLRWCRTTAVRLGYAIGGVVSAPFRILDDFFEGLWRGLFGG